MSRSEQEFWGRAEWNRGGGSDRYDRDVYGARYGGDYTRSSRSGRDRNRGYGSRSYGRYGEDYSYGGYSTGGGHGYGRFRNDSGYWREDREHPESRDYGRDYRGPNRWASHRTGTAGEYRGGSGSRW